MKVSGSSLIVALCIGSVQAFAPSSISRTSTQLQFGIPTFGAGKDKEEKASKNDIDSLPEPKIGMSGLVQLITAGMGAAFLGDFEGVEEDTGKMMFSLEANNLVDENGNSKQTSMPYFESGWVDEDEEKGKKESKGGFKFWVAPAKIRAVNSSITKKWGASSIFSNPARFFGADSQTKHRNIGISAHIDSGKTTLTERILFYTGRINAIHDVRGKDGVGAKMDSMDLEREKGITIQSAATFCQWKDAHINIIDTPGHVDFTIEVERALRVLDGGVLVLCGVSGVQSQSLTVDRQMKRYKVPRVAFINKLDRQGSNPWKVIGDLRDQLKLNAAAVQVPIGLEGEHVGIVDLLEEKAILFTGEKGETLEISDEIPSECKDMFEEKKAELVEMLAEADEEIGDMFLMEETPSKEDLKKAIRRQVIECNFVPVFMGSAFKNKGVQALLDGVLDYLPEPVEKPNFALDRKNDEELVQVTGKNDDDLLALAFKVEETPFGQLTYMRVYQGMLKKGNQVVNVNDGKKIKLARIVRMHSDDMEDIDEAGSGEVVAMFGIDCRSMDTFSDGNMDLVMSSMFVPEPVMSLSIKPSNNKMQNNFAKALNKFTKEDPTLRVKVDDQTKETIISGMGELHLEVYIERMKREYSVEVISGAPDVNYKETIAMKSEFEYLHKKQTGGSGQYAKVVGYVEPLTTEEQKELGKTNQFVNDCIGTNIPPEYYTSCEKGTNDAMVSGSLVGSEVQGVRVVLQDGAAHAVDSSDQAFRTCMAAAVRQAMQKSKATILEPIMRVEIDCPSEFQGSVVAGVNRRMGLIQNSDVNEDGSGVKVIAEVPLANMFGYSTELRSGTQGKGEFTMEYHTHTSVPKNTQEELVKKHREEKAASE